MKEKIENTTQDNFAEAIREKLKNYSPPVNEKSWEEVEKRLNEKSRTKTVLWPWLGGIISVACIVLVWFILPVNKQNFSDSQLIVQQSPKKEEIVEKNLLNEKIQLLSNNTEESNISGHHTKKHFTPENEINFIRETDNTILLNENSPTVNCKNLIAKKETKEQKADKKIIKDSYSSPFTEDNEFTFLSINKKKKNSFGVHLGSSFGKLLADNNSGYLSYNIQTDKNNFISTNLEKLKHDKILTRDDFSDISHHAPLSFGISLRKGINKYISVETGLVYSYLYSKFKNNIPNEELKQELHYLGIPINVITPLYSSKSSKWNIYTSAGVMAEKGLSAHYKHTLHYNNSSPSTISNEKIKGIQWSLNVSIGLDYKIVKNYSIYVQPKLNYYLNNNQPLNSRTENPFNIGIAAGLRYSW